MKTMTDRNKLIDLLCKAPLGFKTFENQYYKSTISKIADYLLANGVIVPPCKVGDKVYFDTYLHGDSVGVQSHKVINVKYVITTEPSKGGIGAEIPDYAFGKTVFLTREEAEKALEGYKENR